MKPHKGKLVWIGELIFIQTRKLSFAVLKKYYKFKKARNSLYAVSSLYLVNGQYQTRTDDILLVRQALYQLS